MEEWKDIEGFPGYQISSEGRVRSYNKVTYNNKSGIVHWKNRIIKQKIARCDGRARVCLWKDKKDYTFLVHRLQAIAFLGYPPGEDYTVNHKDGNPLNNVVENLEWITRADNIRYGFKNGQYGTCKEVSITDGSTDYVFFSCCEADRHIGRYLGYTSERIRTGKTILHAVDGTQYRIKNTKG